MFSRPRNKQKGKYKGAFMGKNISQIFFPIAVQYRISTELETSEHRSWVQGHALQLFHSIYSDKGPLPSGIPGCTTTVQQHEGQLWPTGNQSGIHRHLHEKWMPSCHQHCKIKTSKHNYQKYQKQSQKSTNTKTNLQFTAISTAGFLNSKRMGRILHTYYFLAIYFSNFDA